MRRWSEEKIKFAEGLRATGHSLPEIYRSLRINFGSTGYSSVWNYIKDVAIKPEYLAEWRAKRNSSSRRALKEWEVTTQVVDKLLSTPFSQREFLLVAALLYWAEGGKRGFRIVNTDPLLLQSFKLSLQHALKIPNDRFRFSLVLYEDLDQEKCINFWSKALQLHQSQLQNIQIRKGKKHGKLVYGMASLGLKQPKKEFKLLSVLARSVISLMDTSPRSLTEKTRTS